MLYSKTHVMICHHCCWWCNLQCHSHVKLLTAECLSVLFGHQRFGTSST